MQVIAGSDEFVALGDPDPVDLVVEDVDDFEQSWDAEAKLWRLVVEESLEKIFTLKLPRLEDHFLEQRYHLNGLGVN